MLRISWAEHVCNEEVIGRANYNRRLLGIIRKRQLSFLGHAMRQEGIENLALTGKVCGKEEKEDQG